MKISSTVSVSFLKRAEIKKDRKNVTQQGMDLLSIETVNLFAKGVHAQKLLWK